MKEHEIENAAALLGGWDAWVAAGLPTESSE
jgi:3-mercaptopyruvate sulfurtransferase SseA